MKKEVKICMPYYKIAYSIAFVVILSAIQPVVYANEIGQAVERAVSLLAVVFCADTYLVEVQSKRSEVFCLYNLLGENMPSESGCIACDVTLEDAYIYVTNR